ncbi:hypothetical protein ACUY4R_001734 [Kosakonia sp. BK9b]|uniref:hypothetical protein n=1 Tax=Kosakonia sp. TaxID=1916651 RepID=UPI00289C4AFD|nr:hypothetical protein [Kosakonia sp.]
MILSPTNEQGALTVTDDDLNTLLKDKTDYRKRLHLVTLLRGEESARSSAALVYLAQHDFVYQVRIAAWRVAQERNIACTMPQPRPRYAIMLEKTLERVKRLFKAAADFSLNWLP